ncbi:MAG: NAD(P)-binding domain-containing protein [Chloroflexota bacterium]
MEHTDVLVVGGGQAGLAVSHELAGHGIDHVVLERGRIGQTWRDRWDTFCLVTPNWTVQLPGGTYAGADPDGFMPRDEIVAYLEGYAADSASPVREGVAVHSIDGVAGRFVAQTSAGEIGAGRVVLATGAFQRAHRPAGSEGLPGDLLQIDIADYRNPDALPAGPILIVGSGQSGAQLAEELREAGREVVLSCGKAPWAPRRFGGKDLLWWLVNSGFLEQPVGTITVPGARLLSNPLATGHGGGHDLSLRTLRAMGVALAGRFLGADGRRARFAPDLAESVAWGDARYHDIMALAVKTADARGIARPEIAVPEPFDGAAQEEVSLEGFGAVLFAGGFRPDYRSWLPWTDAFDASGFPIQIDGASSVVDGLFFVGTHFLRTRKSAILYGVGEDAAVVAQSIAGEVAAA